MNLEFTDPTIEDKEWVQKILNQEKKINSESAFGTCYLWSHYYSTKICKYKNMFFKKVGNENIGYECPQGAKSTEDFKDAINAIISDAKENEYDELILTDFLDSEVKKIQEIFPGKFNFTPSRESFEYIYKTQDLALLPGKKYHSKRNHISRFSKMFQWNYKPTVAVDTEKFLVFFEKCFNSRATKEPFQKISEYEAIKKALESYEELELSGGIIEVGEEIVACTIGEEINENVFLVHFEKALPEFKEAYSVINNKFCKTLSNKYTLVNREEDLNIPGLRKSKLSYHPIILLPKYKSVLKAYRNL